jgi:hypothetical protein
MPWHEQQPDGHKIKPPYTIMAARLKMNHPCFFHLFYLNHVDGGFPLHGGLSSLWGFADIAFEPPGGFCLSQLYGIHHYNRIAP